MILFVVRRVLLACALIPLSLPAVAATPTPAAETAREGAFMALSVASLDRQVAWYRDVLGFTILEQRDVAERGIRFALLEREGALIELLQLPEARARLEVDPAATSASRIHGFFKAGFVVRDIDRLQRELQEKGATFSLPLGEPGSAGLRMFQLKDPEGNLLQFLGR